MTVQHLGRLLKDELYDLDPSFPPRCLGKNDAGGNLGGYVLRIEKSQESYCIL